MIFNLFNSHFIRIDFHIIGTVSHFIRADFVSALIDLLEKSFIYLQHGRYPYSKIITNTDGGLYENRQIRLLKTLYFAI